MPRRGQPLHPHLQDRGDGAGPLVKGLVIRAPWFADIANGDKHTEHRSWPTSWRGMLGICAAKRADSEEYAGHVVCITRITDCIKRGERDYVWHLGPVVCIDPVPVAGRLGLFDLVDTLAPALVRRIIGQRAA
jgi:hypothetical protein